MDPRCRNLASAHGELAVTHQLPAPIEHVGDQTGQNRTRMYINAMRRGGNLPSATCVLRRTHIVSMVRRRNLSASVDIAIKAFIRTSRVTINPVINTARQLGRGFKFTIASCRQRVSCQMHSPRPAIPDANCMPVRAVMNRVYHADTSASASPCMSELRAGPVYCQTV